MIKKILLSAIATLSFSTPTFAQTAPGLAYQSVSTGYGQFGCLQRAQSKLYQIGATNVYQKNGAYVYGTYGTEKIAVWCRGAEAIIIVAGTNTGVVRDEVATAF